MRIDPTTGLLQNCRQCPSPNCDERPEGTTIDLIVIHCISLPPGEYGGEHIERFFQNRLDSTAHPYFREIHDMRVSAHFLIKRNGDIVQFVPLHQRAWHAGISSYRGRERCNDFSIGIELEGTDTDTYEDEQYRQLAGLIDLLRRTWPAIGNRIAAHSEIAPGRKTDPGSGFDWQRLNQLLDSNFAEKTL